MFPFRTCSKREKVVTCVKNVPPSTRIKARSATKVSRSSQKTTFFCPNASRATISCDKASKHSDKVYAWINLITSISPATVSVAYTAKGGIRILLSHYSISNAQIREFSTIFHKIFCKIAILFLQFGNYML